MKSIEKTNVMRLLDQKKIKYTPHSYANSEAISGIEVASYLNEDPSKVFKTLVTVGSSKKNYVFVLPSTKELHLKKAAKAVGEKSIEMVKSKELLGLTGYIHGGCSPVGMKKFFTTTIDISAQQLDVFYCSAGKIGYQIEISPKELAKIIRFEYADITE